MRGWIAAVLLIFSALLWAAREPGDNAADTRGWTLHCFMFTAPIAVIYSFRALKLAPDRLLARAAFFGSFLIAAALLFMLCGLIYALFVTMSSPTSAPKRPVSKPRVGQPTLQMNQTPANTFAGHKV